MVRQAGYLAETLVALAIGLALTLVMVSIWGSDASRRVTEIEGSLARNDLNEATFYLPILWVPAEHFTVVSAADMRAEMGPSTVTALSDVALRISHPFSVIFVYLGHSAQQVDPAVWIYQNRFGNTSHHALMDARGAFQVVTDVDRVCLYLSNPDWSYCHRRLPGQVIDV